MIFDRNEQKQVVALLGAYRRWRDCINPHRGIQTGIKQ